MYNVQSCVCCPDVSAPKVNFVVSAAAGLFFFVGWWLLIDVSIQHQDVMYVKKVYNVPGIFGTFALVVINSIPNERLQNSYYYTSAKYCGACTARLTLFISFVFAFGSLIGASYILVNDFMLAPEREQWPGYGIFFQNVFIFTANMFLKFCTRSDVW